MVIRLLLLALLWQPTTAKATSLRNRRRTASCGTPSFVGEWERLPDYPFSTIEAQGGFVGGDFVVTGGYFPDSSTATTQTWALPVGGSSWTRKADYPLAEGLTHGAFAIHNDKLYLCGGYLGGNPGPAIDNCFVYDHTANSWTELPSLPEPRGAGGLLYSAEDNALIFSSGAERVAVGAQESMDFVDTWMLPLTATAWTEKADGLLLGNHVSSVTGVDGMGKEHYYFLGGQVSEDEEAGNIDQVEEYIAMGDTWQSRASMEMKRGHANAGVIPYSCGIIIAGGSINGRQTTPLDPAWWRALWGIIVGWFTNPSSFNFNFNFPARRATTSDVSYYDIDTDTWSKMGDFSSSRKTLVCDVEDDWLYCGTGGTNEVLRRKLSR